MTYFSFASTLANRHINVFIACCWLPVSSWVLDFDERHWEVVSVDVHLILVCWLLYLMQQWFKMCNVLLVISCISLRFIHTSKLALLPYIGVGYRATIWVTLYMGYSTCIAKTLIKHPPINAKLKKLPFTHFIGRGQPRVIATATATHTKKNLN